MPAYELKAIANAQPGAEILRPHAEDDLETAEYGSVILANLLERFGENGDLTETTDEIDALVVMHDKPSFVKTYPFEDSVDGNSESNNILIFVEPEAEVTPEDIAEHLTVEDLLNKTYVFPAIGMTLGKNGFQNNLGIDSKTAKTFFEQKNISHHDLHSTGKGLLGAIRHRRLAKRISRLIGDNQSVENESSNLAKQKAVQQKYEEILERHKQEREADAAARAEAREVRDREYEEMLQQHKQEREADAEARRIAREQEPAARSVRNSSNTQQRLSARPEPSVMESKQDDHSPVSVLDQSRQRRQEELAKKNERKGIETLYLETADALLNMDAQERAAEIEAIKLRWDGDEDQEAIKITSKLNGLVERIGNPQMNEQKRHRLRRTLGMGLSYLQGVEKQ